MSLTQPQIIPEGFCNAGTAGIDYVIPPVSSLNPDIVTQDKAYPVSQATPLNANGVAVNRPQTNGLWKLATDAIAFLNKGGNYTFDSALTGGYSKDAILWCASNNTFQRSLVNNNTANFITNPEYINDGVNWAEQGSNAVNQVTAKGTPTFPAGEEYIISPRNFSGEVQQTIVFQRKYINSTSVNYGTSSITFSITHNEAYGSTNYHINVISSNNLPISYFGFKSYLLTAPFTINGNTFGIGNAMVVLYLKKPLPSTNTTNSVYGDYLSTSTGFIYNINLNPVLFEPVAEGTITGSVIDLAFTTNATINQLQDSSTNIYASELGAVKSVRSSGTGDSDGYGFVASTPNGIYAVNGNSQLGNLIMVESSSANKGIAYPGTPGAAGPYTMEFGWGGSPNPRVVGRVDYNNAVLFTLANYSDVVNNGVGIVASGSGWVKFANGLIIQQFYAVNQSGIGNFNVTYPIPFTTINYIVIPVLVGTNNFYLVSRSTTGCVVDCGTNSALQIFAIGY